MFAIVFALTLASAPVQTVPETRIVSTTVQCPRCFGRGYCPEARKPSRNNPNALGFYARRCPRCSGAGQVEEHQRKAKRMPV